MGWTPPIASDICYVAYISLFGLYLSLLGLRGLNYRFTTASTLALVSFFVIWTIVANGTPAGGLGTSAVNDEIVLILIAGSLSMIGAAFGYLHYGRTIGYYSIGGMGGLAFGFSLILVKKDFLIPAQGANWVIIIIPAVVATGCMFTIERYQRMTLAWAISQTGLFCLALATLILLKGSADASSPAFGIRKFLDNSAYGRSKTTGSFAPDILTSAVMGGSTALAILLAFIQAKAYHAPFKRDEMSLQEYMTQMIETEAHQEKFFFDSDKAALSVNGPKRPVEFVSGPIGVVQVGKVWQPRSVNTKVYS